jgi:hypothetical protein
LLVRIAAGVVVLGALAVWDYRRHGSDARRWKEYAFLAGMVSLALFYGIANDQITVSISWEYFYYGKGVADKLGYQQPTDFSALRWEAAKIGMQATWTAGLLAGVALLMANNPRQDRPSASWTRLSLLGGAIFVSAALGGVLLGLAGYVGLLGGLLGFPDDMPWRVAPFMTVYGVHLGGYLGGLFGAVGALVHLLCWRRRFAPPETVQLTTGAP